MTKAEADRKGRYIMAAVGLAILSGFAVWQGWYGFAVTAALLDALHLVDMLLVTPRGMSK